MDTILYVDELLLTGYGWVTSSGRGTLNWISGCSIPASRTSFSTTFLKNCGRGESLETTMCNKSVVGGKQGHVPCRILLLHKASFCQ